MKFHCEINWRTWGVGVVFYRQAEVGTGAAFFVGPMQILVELV